MPRHRRRRPRVHALPTLVAVASLAAAWAMSPAPSAAQSLTIGGHAGVSVSRQSVRGGDASSDRTGFLVGAFVQVRTPAPWLGVLAEASFVQRGGSFPLAGGQDGDVRVDYLVISVAPLARRSLGPLNLFLYGGPSLETHLQVRAAAELAGAYREPNDQIFSVQIGGGIATTVAGRWSLRLEARHVEGLSAAFDSGAGEFRHRSREIVLRLGRFAGP